MCVCKTEREVSIFMELSVSKLKKKKGPVPYILHVETETQKWNRDALPVE